jgi:hypothetical protein
MSVSSEPGFRASQRPLVTFTGASEIPSSGTVGECHQIYMICNYLKQMVIILLSYFHDKVAIQQECIQYITSRLN